MADTIKCPNCSANLVFDADAQKMRCDWCGAMFTTKELEDLRVDELEEVASSKEQSQVQTDTSVPEEESKTEEIPQEQPDAQEYVCNSCGAVVVTDANTSASFCAFCGSPALVGSKLTREFRPSKIIPFKYGKEKAVEKFFEWCKGGRMTPLDFVSDRNIEKLTGLYVPFWLFDVDGHLDIEATATKSSSVTTGSKTVTTVRTYRIKRRRKYHWSRIPLDGETKVDDLLMEAIEPFKYKDLRDYDYRYLSGFYADVYDLDNKALEQRLVKRITEYIDEEYKLTVKNYPSPRIVSNKNRIGGIKAEYALLPVWFLHYKYLNKDYYFAMNGQTGEVAGVPPVSVLKRLLLCTTVMTAVALIVKIIAMLFLKERFG
ncbi:MAG: hypothetical protein J5685_04440 [Clostridiales bacterium]|nr:hypothetical protein [Clostridiales bacterium]